MANKIKNIFLFPFRDSQYLPDTSNYLGNIIYLIWFNLFIKGEFSSIL